MDKYLETERNAILKVKDELKIGKKMFHELTANFQKI